MITKSRNFGIVIHKIPKFSQREAIRKPLSSARILPGRLRDDCCLLAVPQIVVSRTTQRMCCPNKLRSKPWIADSQYSSNNKGQDDGCNCQIADAHAPRT
jgi:hypothetical protein